jgi:hypothetical protein
MARYFDLLSRSKDGQMMGIENKVFRGMSHLLLSMDLGYKEGATITKLEIDPYMPDKDVTTVPAVAMAQPAVLSCGLSLKSSRYTLSSATRTVSPLTI